MALAYVCLKDWDDTGYECEFDIGINRYYAFSIGARPERHSGSLITLQDPIFTSPLIGPLPDESLGRGHIRIPCKHIDRENKYLQLLSFRKADRTGPALSEPISLPVHPKKQMDKTGRSFTQGVNMPALKTSAETVRMSYREVPYG